MHLEELGLGKKKKKQEAKGADLIQMNYGALGRNK